MTPHQLQIILGIIAYLAYNVAVASAPHWAEIRSPFWRAVVAFLGRTVLLRHQSGPKTFHFLGTKQPWWNEGQLEELAAHIAMAAPVSFGCLRCGAPPVNEGPLLHSPGCDAIPGRVEVSRGPLLPPGAPLGWVAAIALFALATLPACQSFAQLAELARRTYDAASDAEERAPDPDTKAKARGCGKAARDAVRAADAAQLALVDKAPGYGALKVAADQAEARMRTACRPLQLDVTTGPAPDLGAPRPADLRPAAPPAAPDMGSAPAAPAAADLAPRPATPDGGR